MDRHADLLAQGCLEEGAKGWAKPMLLQQETDAMCLEEWCNTNLQHRQTASKRERADDAKKSMTNRTTRYEERSAAHCTPMQCITSGACDGQDACHQDRSGAAVSSMTCSWLTMLEETVMQHFLVYILYAIIRVLAYVLST